MYGKLLIFFKKNKKIILYLLFILFAFIAGTYLGGNSDSVNIYKNIHQSNKIWTCSMHPQVQQSDPGQCPLCGMDLIPVSEEESVTTGPREIKLSESAQIIANIQVKPVTKKFVTSRIRLFGKIDFDETRLKFATTRVPGRIDRMFVNYTGTPVRKGDHLFEIFSPELITTQKELIESVNSQELSQSEILRQNLTAIKERLRLWGLTEDQIDNIADSKNVTDQITVYSPVDGIVIKKDGFEGMYVETGTRIYTIADLSTLWLKLDVYESDIPWIRYGQNVKFETKSYPGEIFSGIISFISPVLDEKTRTIKIRVNVKNSANKLKPGMFARAYIESKIAAGGKVVDSSLSGKWISPMHPEIIKDKPGLCDVCGMKLVPVEDLGYISSNDFEKNAPLVIPASAPLITGKRAVVYVKKENQDGIFEGREIVLGPRADDFYIVKEGLSEGELVVVNGNFKIDSEIQIRAKPSMMSQAVAHNSLSVNKTEKLHKHDREIKKFVNIPDTFLKQLNEVFNEYFAIQQALSDDNYNQAKEKSKSLSKKSGIVDVNILNGNARQEWLKLNERIVSTAADFSTARNLDTARIIFESLSKNLIITLKYFGGDGSQNIYLYHCPMAFDFKGADWLQNIQGTENPYFGAEMFQCGSLRDTLAQKK